MLRIYIINSTSEGTVGRNPFQQVGGQEFLRFRVWGVGFRGLGFRVLGF